METISRDAARALGLKRYFTGMPCGRCGQVAERQTGGCKCVECNRRKVDRPRYRAGRAIVTARNRRGIDASELPAPRLAGHCDLCSKPAKLHWDHDHVLADLGFTPAETHRGWLCFHCNTGLGKLGDTPQSLARALAYTRGQLPR